MNTQELLSRSLKLLQSAIRASGMTQTEVDVRIGRRRGYLSHVFQRRVDLKVEDLMLALEVLGIDAARFFETVSEAQATGGSGMLRLVSQRAQAEPVSTAPAQGSEDGQALLEARVRKALRSILSQLSAAEDPRRVAGSSG